MRPQYDYVIVGSGAGGGTLAARLAEAGMTVCVLEAGGDSNAPSAGGGLPEDYQVPAFHPFASENKAMAWNFVVNHYTDPDRQRRDWKFRDGGVLYPRAGTLGGCTAHNALIFVRPHDSDWNAIARLTGDRSWRARAMNRYFRRVEACRHRPLWRWIAEKTGFNPTGHGWNGWMPTELALPREAFGDDEVRAAVDDATHAIWRGEGGWFEGLLSSAFWALDPNNYAMVGRRLAGMFATPLSTDRGMRHGTRERLLDVARRHPERLHIECDALATHVVLDADRRATGVAYLKGRGIYGASAVRGTGPGTPAIAHAAREVILAGGAFNTPQLLMLSGLGPAGELARHGIRVHVDLPGVGRNLQDRYEVSVVNRMTRPWSSLRGARFCVGDPLWREWQQSGRGMYRSNGAALAFTRRSSGRTRDDDPDLFFMALLTKFRGYYPGYSDEIRTSRDHLSWVILKAHTNNRAGTVTLRSADPTDPPIIDFNYFQQGDEDLNAVVEGIQFVRKMTSRLRDAGRIGDEEFPGDHVGDEALADYVRDTAWGHHASCGAAIGARESNGVLTSKLTVHGTRSLRVVDASVFPRIPGFFIASPIMMVAEKAADMILEAAKL